MSKKSSLVYQIKETLLSKVQEGRSKHQDKITGADSTNIIYSWQTYRTYVKQCCEIARWAKEEYGCHHIAEVKEHVPEYLTMRADSVSPYTVHLDAAAAAKLYGCSSVDWGVELPKRERAGIERSRLPREHDLEFSQTRNKNSVDFGRGTGLRRCELVALTPVNITPDGKTVIVENGKGGKYREVPVLPQYQQHIGTMREKALKTGQDRVFLRSEIKNRMDEHAYRREYAQALYQHYESTGEYTTGKKYYCRKDAAGTVFDKGIMAAVSRALGHNRIDVVAISYLI